MPDSLLDSGSEFDLGVMRLGQWLRNFGARPRALTGDELTTYSGHEFRAGWAITLEYRDEAHRFEVLVDACFPYSAIRIALKTADMLLKWPHVEPSGLLCLPVASSPLVDEAAAADEALSAALRLIDQCREAEFVESEFRREFLSYWSRSTHEKDTPVYSLLDPSNHEARLISVWFGKAYTLVGEDENQVRNWLINRGKIDKLDIAVGLFGHLRTAPIPPFPNTPGQLLDLLANQSPDARHLLDRCSCRTKLPVILGASSANGDGLMAVILTAPGTNGFRKSQCDMPSVKLKLWKDRSVLKRARVERFDAAWVHGRGLNQSLPKLRAANVLILGCGSLGSQVAIRLAQSGVGNLTLVDPEPLSSANVGRHALGIADVGRYKSTALATEIRQSFPHILKAEGHGSSWQQFYAKNRQAFESFDLIVVCIGEWSAEGQLAEWQQREGFPRHVVYGWLDERGTAAHALALPQGVPGLTCVLGPDGNLRFPETVWKEQRSIQAEPACGTLFQPYGPIDVGIGETVVSRLCVDLLADTVKGPVHRVYATSTKQLTEAGGKWSEEHLKYRPQGFDGAFEYERHLEPCRQCNPCKEAL